MNLSAKHETCRRSASALWMLAISALAALGVLSPANAQRWTRKGQVDIYGVGQYLAGGQADYSKFGVRLDIKETGLGGLGFGYNFTDHLNLNLELLLGNTDFVASGPGPNLIDDTLIASGKVNLDYNLLKSRFTPVLTGGLGFFTFSSKLQNADPVLVCYYDSWWGNYCAYATPTYDETDLSFNAGAGFRWDPTDYLFVKAIGGATWVKLRHSDDFTHLFQATLTVGAKF